jgi:FkbM family methyltransferase
MNATLDSSLAKYQPTPLFDPVWEAPTRNALARGLRAVLIERRLPYVVERRIEKWLCNIGLRERTVSAAGYKVSCRRASMDEVFIDSVLVREEYFNFHPGFRPCPGDTVIDVGANIGAFALVAAKYVGPSGKILSIEPHPDNLRYLRRNIDRNDLRNVRIIDGGVSASRGRFSLYVSPESGLHSMLIDHGHGSIEIETYPLADLMRESRIETCDLLKVDCEGAEHDILPSIDAGTWRRIKRVAMEYTVPVRDWCFTSPKPEHVELKRSMADRLVDILVKNGFAIDGYYDCVGHRSGYVFATAAPGITM